MEQIIKQGVILAGGRGERLRPFTDTMPKPMYPINGKPFIDRLLLQMKSFGIDRVLILLGYLAEQVIAEVGDGSQFGIQTEYDITPLEYDTGDRLMHALEKLDDRFVLMYCDNYCPVDFMALESDSSRSNALIQLSVYANKDKYTKDNLLVQENGKVVVYDKSRKEINLSGVDIGYAIVKKEALSFLENGSGSLSSVYAKLVDEGKLYATVTEHRYYSIGSYSRISLTEEFFREKRVVFLDRDGTLNVRPPKACYVEKPEEFIWIAGAIDAISMLKENSFTIILISNQPGIARGNLSVHDLDAIHNKMQSDLKRAGALIDYIYYCPHNWDEGCECRKPKAGLLFQAQKDLSLNLRECVLFGDDERDIAAGKKAGCATVLVSDEYPLLEAVKDFLRKLS